MNTPGLRHPEALTLAVSDLLTPDQVATALGLSQRTLAAWRSTRRSALPWCRVGARIRYRRQDVIAWLESRTHSNSEA